MRYDTRQMDIQPGASEVTQRGRGERDEKAQSWKHKHTTSLGTPLGSDPPPPPTTRQVGSAWSKLQAYSGHDSLVSARRISGFFAMIAVDCR